ncbi:hypothetical protein [Porphyromonas gingivalis]|nr:hypothetical protein [Porphyromonas gingivalis]ERJ82457.1 hypothetical protein HMPREF1988_01544 [Porphyromonas gingivalis F0185]MDH7903883.1 hypothetical protein [Porphyromonas gingivalis]
MNPKALISAGKTAAKIAIPILIEKAPVIWEKARKYFRKKKEEKKTK